MFQQFKEEKGPPKLSARELNNWDNFYIRENKILYKNEPLNLKWSKLDIGIIGIGMMVCINQYADVLCTGTLMYAGQNGLSLYLFGPWQPICWCIGTLAGNNLARNQYRFR